MTAVAGETARGDMSVEVGELAKALALAQGEIASAIKGKTAKTPQYSYNFADLAAVWEACRGPLTKNGLSVTQFPINDGERVGLVSTLLHQSGQWMRSECWIRPDKPGPQGVGSALTYLRRYMLASIAGVATEDDDGQAAQGDGSPKGNGAPAEKAKRADKVKAAHDSVMANEDQVKLIHVLRGKIGGMTEDQYRRGLAGYKKADGTPCTTSKELTEQQANNLITRFRTTIDRQEKNLREREPDIRAIGGAPGEPVSVLKDAARKLDVIDLQEEVLSEFGVDRIEDLKTDEDRADCLALVMAHAQSREAFERVRERVRERLGVVS